MTALTYSAPCTACGEGDHGRDHCEHAPTVETFEERATPAAIGWRFTTRYPDGGRSTWELCADPETGELLATQRMGDDGRWSPPIPWRGHRPGSVREARAYALAYAHGADLPPDAGRCSCRECEGTGPRP